MTEEEMNEMTEEEIYEYQEEVLMKINLARAIVREEMVQTLSPVLDKYGYSAEQKTELFRKIIMDVAENLFGVNLEEEEK